MKMKRNIFLTMLVMILAFGMTVVSCDDGGDDGDDNNNDGWIKGWPNSTVLANYGISGLTQPSGATDVEYKVSDESATNGGTRTNLVIGYKGTNSDGEAIRTWFNNQSDWTVPSYYSPYDFIKGTNTNASGNVYYEAGIDWLFADVDMARIFNIYKTVW